MGFNIQGRINNYFAGAPLASKKVVSNGEWQKVELVFKVPTTGKWGKCNNVLLTTSSTGKNSVTLFDDFKVEEK